MNNLQSVAFIIMMIADLTAIFSGFRLWIAEKHPKVKVCILIATALVAVIIKILGCITIVKLG